MTGARSSSPRVLKYGLAVILGLLTVFVVLVGTGSIFVSNTPPPDGAPVPPAEEPLPPPSGEEPGLPSPEPASQGVVLADTPVYDSPDLSTPVAEVGHGDTVTVVCATEGQTVSYPDQPEVESSRWYVVELPGSPSAAFISGLDLQVGDDVPAC